MNNIDKQLAALRKKWKERPDLRFIIKRQAKALQIAKELKNTELKKQSELNSRYD